MPYDGAGNFTRSYNWTADKIANIKIESERMDGEFDNYANSMNQLVLRNGVVPFAGDVKLGGNKITGLASGSALAPAITFLADTQTGFFLSSVGVLGLTAGGVGVFACTASGAAVQGAFGINTGVPRTALDVIGISSLQAAFEQTAYAATGLTGTVQVDVITSPIVIYDANAVANWTFNVRGSSSLSLNSIMGIGQTLTLAIEVPQGATPFYCTAITVDGAAPAQIKWFSPTGAPTSGHASSIDVYQITIYKKAAATFYVRASQSQAK